MAPPTAAMPRAPAPPMRDEPTPTPTTSTVRSDRKRPATTSGDATVPVLKRKPLVVQTLLEASGSGVTLRLPSKTDASSQRITPLGKVRKLRHAVQAPAKSARKLPGVGFGTTPRFPRSPSPATSTVHPSSRAASGFQGWKRARPLTTTISSSSTKPKATALKRPSTSVSKPPTTPVQASRKPSHQTTSTLSTPETSVTKSVPPSLVQAESATPPAPARSVDTEMTLVTQILASIQARSCRLVCIDFDKTLLDIHTNGEWAMAAEDLTGHVRPLFVSLLPHLHATGVYLAITTFSPQADLVHRVLQLVLDPTTASAIHIFADTNARAPPLYKHGDDDGDAEIPAHVLLDKRHKLPYVLSAARRRAVRLCHALLMDDDATNLHDVAAYSVQTLWFEQHESLQSLAAKLSTPKAHTNAHATPIKTAHVAAPRSERIGRPVKPKKQRALVY